MLHLAHFLEHLDFIQDTKKYAELDDIDPYKLQKMNDEIQKTKPKCNGDKVSPFVHFFNERIPKLQQDLKNTIALKQTFSSYFDEIKIILKQTIDQKNLEQISKKINKEFIQKAIDLSSNFHIP